MSRHDCLVDLIVKDLKTIHKDSQIYQHTTVELSWLCHNTYNRDYFNLLTVTGPPVGPFAIACLKQLYPILKLI